MIIIMANKNPMVTPFNAFFMNLVWCGLLSVAVFIPPSSNPFFICSKVISLVPII